MSPVERTAAWVLNNGQYEEDVEESEQNPDEAKHAEKVEPSLSLLTYCPHRQLRPLKDYPAKNTLSPTPSSPLLLRLTMSIYKRSVVFLCKCMENVHHPTGKRVRYKFLCILP
jgi:hypothetical protein